MRSECHVLLLLAVMSTPTAVESRGLADEPSAVDTVIDAKATSAKSGVSEASTNGVPEGDNKPARPRRKRILIVLPADCLNCVSELKRLESGPFEKLRSRGWNVGRGPENHIQIVSATDVAGADLASVIATLPKQRSLTACCIEDDKILRSFRYGCTTPLDQWTFGWLMTGNDERPAAFTPKPIQVVTSGNYPLRGNHWSVDGNWNPSREYIIRHLRSIHAGSLQANWNIETWSLEELKSVHDDIHDREEGFRGRYGGTSSRSSGSSRSGVRKPGKRT